MTDDHPPLRHDDAGRGPESAEDQLRAFGQKLDRFLDKADRSLAIGRELVEQRAENLDLRRQIHRLEEELRFLKAGAGDAATTGALTDLSAPRAGAERRGGALGRRLLRLIGR